MVLSVIPSYFMGEATMIFHSGKLDIYFASLMDCCASGFAAPF